MEQNLKICQSCGMPMQEERYGSEADGGRDTEKNLFGEKGGYQTMLSRKIVGKPRPYCRNLIQKASYMGGTVYFCPVCQET